MNCTVSRQPRMSSRRRSLVLVASLCACAIPLGGCLDAPGTGPHPDPVIGGVLVAAAEGGVAEGSTTIGNGRQAGELTLRTGISNALVLRVLGTDGNDEPVVSEFPGEFEVRVLQNGALLAATASGYPYSVAVTPTGTGLQTFSVEVYATEPDRSEFLRQFDATVKPD